MALALALALALAFGVGVGGSWFMVHGVRGCSWYGGVHGGPGGCGCVVVVRGGSWFEGVRSSNQLRARAFGAAEEARAARIRGADGTQGKSHFISFHFGVCVCREASSSQVVIA